MASVSLDLLVAFAERFTSRASEIALDGSVFGFALLAAVAASVFFTMLPALPGGDSLGDALTRGGVRSTIGAGAKRAQRALVVAQIGTSFVLLIGAGLLLRTMIHLQSVDPGFDTAQILSMDVPANTVGRTEAEVRTHYLSVLDDVRDLPGVEQAALTSAVPLTPGRYVLDPDGDGGAGLPARLGRPTRREPTSAWCPPGTSNRWASTSSRGDLHEHRSRGRAEGARRQRVGSTHLLRRS